MQNYPLIYKKITIITTLTLTIIFYKININLFGKIYLNSSKLPISILYKLTNKDLFKPQIKYIYTTTDSFLKFYIPLNPRKIYTMFTKKGTKFKILQIKAQTFYYIPKKKIYIPSTCTKILFPNTLKIIKECLPYKNLNTLLHTKKILKTNTTFNFFHKIEKEIFIGSNASFPNKIFIIPQSLSEITINLKNKQYYEPVPLNMIFLVNPKAIPSPYIDNLTYTTNNFGVYVSKNMKQWFRLKQLLPQKYTIYTTDKGCLIANNLLSCNYGKKFINLLKFIIKSPQKTISHYQYYNNYPQQLYITTKNQSIILFNFNTLEIEIIYPFHFKIPFFTTNTIIKLIKQIFQNQQIIQNIHISNYPNIKNQYIEIIINTKDANILTKSKFNSLNIINENIYSIRINSQQVHIKKLTQIFLPQY